jgi:Domain of unknown function (DUF6484)
MDTVVKQAPAVEPSPVDKVGAGLENPPGRSERASAAAVDVGVLCAITSTGQALVNIERIGRVVESESCVVLTPGQLGHRVAVVYDRGRCDRPIVIGVLVPVPAAADPAPRGVTIDIDQQRLTVTAAKEIVLRCGSASITLTRAGKILLRGEYISAHASGVQRITGATVEIN